MYISARYELSSQIRASLLTKLIEPIRHSHKKNNSKFTIDFRFSIILSTNPQQKTDTKQNLPQEFQLVQTRFHFHCARLGWTQRRLKALGAKAGAEVWAQRRSGRERQERIDS